MFLIVAGAMLAPAHDVITTKLTWSTEISRIVYKHCTGCHREGGSAPMSLVRFEDASPWAKAIRDEVLGRRMPPWGAVKGFGEFRDDVSLTQDEITRIAEWVEGGAPEGDPKYLPPTVPPPPRSAAVPAGIAVRSSTLTRPVTLVGVHPLGDAANAKITAHTPDGEVVPLIWLLNYQHKWNHTFVYRKPLTLPAGTRLKADPPVPFEVLMNATTLKSPPPAH